MQGQGQGQGLSSLLETSRVWVQKVKCQGHMTDIAVRLCVKCVNSFVTLNDVRVMTVSCFETVVRYFCPRDALHSAVFAVVRCLSVCLYVCLSHARIVSKRLNLS